MELFGCKLLARQALKVQQAQQVLMEQQDQLALKVLQVWLEVQAPQVRQVRLV
jgi:hypothetical protein